MYVVVSVFVCVLWFGKQLGKKYSCSDWNWDISLSWVAIYRTTVMTQSAKASKHADTHRQSLAHGQVWAFHLVHRHAAWPLNNSIIVWITRQ